MAEKCTAKRKHDGQHCQQYAINGTTKCRYHGGASLKGIAQPSFRDGRYSKYMPARMLDKYNASLKDPAALTQRHELALIESRIEDLIKRTDSGESGALMKELRGLARQHEQAVRANDPVEVMRTMKELVGLIKQGNADYRAWDDIHKWTMAREKMVASERKRQVEAQQTVTLEEMMAVISALGEILRRHVTDMGVLNAVTTDIGRLINSSDKKPVGDPSRN